MRKQSKLLKVLSIILIVLGALSLLSSIALLAMQSTMAATYATMGITPPSTFSMLLSFVGSIILLVSGIIGVSYKSRQLVLIVGIILAAYYVISIVYSGITTGFTPLSFIGLVWPLLYLWGWYQSN